MKFLPLLFVLVVLTSGCAGVSTSLQVRSNVLPPATTIAIADSLDRANAALFNATVSNWPGRFESNVDVRVQGQRTTVRTNRTWRAQ